MQAWYLLYCKRGQLQRAQEHLERQSVNCLTPVITLEKMQRGKRTTVSEPLFPNYLFVEFDPVRNPVVQVRSGISLVSVENAAQNLAADIELYLTGLYPPRPVVTIDHESGPIRMSDENGCLMAYLTLLLTVETNQA